MAQSNYFLTYLISMDTNLRVRLEACVATEADRSQIDYIDNPTEWVYEHRWDYAVTPGWVDAVSYAVENGSEDWGKDPLVITDAMILGRTQELLAADDGATP